MRIVEEVAVAWKSLIRVAVVGEVEVDEGVKGG